MKIQMLLLISLAAFFQFCSCDAQGNKDTKTNTSLQTEMVEVYYFHFTRRCETCMAVENESRKAVEELYANALEEEEGKQTADKLNISSQTLLVVKSGEKIDLTSQGFMYARTDPEKLKKALQDAIGKISFSFL